MEKTITPSACLPTKDEKGVETPALYEGTVTMRVPTYDDRLEFSEMALSLPEAEEEIETPEGVEVKLTPAQKARRLAHLKMLAKMAPSFFVRADLKRKADGFKIETWDQIQLESELAKRLVPELGAGLMESHALGKTST